MTKQDWVKEIIAEEVVGAINRFKNEKPYALHDIALDAAVVTIRRLSDGGVVIKTEHWLPTRNGMTCTIETLM